MRANALHVYVLLRTLRAPHDATYTIHYPKQARDAARRRPPAPPSAHTTFAHAITATRGRSLAVRPRATPHVLRPHAAHGAHIQTQHRGIECRAWGAWGAECGVRSAECGVQFARHGVICATHRSPIRTLAFTRALRIFPGARCPCPAQRAWSNVLGITCDERCVPRGAITALSCWDATVPCAHCGRPARSSPT
jgi:hypothetical protein